MFLSAVNFTLNNNDPSQSDKQQTTDPSNPDEPIEDSDNQYRSSGYSSDKQNDDPSEDPEEEPADENSSTLQENEDCGCCGDFNSDGKVGLVDFDAFSAAYGRSEDSPKFNSLYDFYKDGVVDDTDYNIFLAYYDNCYPCYEFSACDCDFDGDGKVRLLDVSIFQVAYGSSKGDPKWKPSCDIIPDGEINDADWHILLAFFGEVCRE